MINKLQTIYSTGISRKGFLPLLLRLWLLPFAFGRSSIPTSRISNSSTLSWLDYIGHIKGGGGGGFHQLHRAFRAADR